MQLVVVALAKPTVLEDVCIHAVRLVLTHVVLVAPVDVQVDVAKTVKVLAEVAEMDALMRVEPAVGVSAHLDAKDALVTAGVDVQEHVTDAVAVLAVARAHVTDAE